MTKKPGPPKSVPPKIAGNIAPPSTLEEKRAARNVTKLKAKLSAALDDPTQREQIVRAMRAMINEDKE